MATIQNEILDSFYAALFESGEVDQGTVNALHALFQSGKKFKADDFVAALSKDSKEETVA